VNGNLLNSKDFISKTTLTTRLYHKTILCCAKRGARREIENSGVAVPVRALFATVVEVLVKYDFQQLFSVNRSENETAAGDVLTQNCRK